MRIAFLGMNGPLSRETISVIARYHELVVVARPAPATPTRDRPGVGLKRRIGGTLRAFGLRGGDPLARIAQDAGVRVHDLIGPHDLALANQVGEKRVDLLCVAGFPWLLPLEVLEIPSLGAINVHAALLPRHRGPLPLFWIYHADDRTTGVTVHWMNERADAGDVIRQSAFPLPRGEHVDRLNHRNAETAGPLLRSALDDIAAGTAARTPHDETRATAAPFVRSGTPMVAFDEWDVERVWHFTTGLYPRFIEPLTDADGRAVRYLGVSGFSRESHARRPGSVERSANGFDLFCRGGRVHLRGAP